VRLGENQLGLLQFLSSSTRRRRGKYWTAGNDISVEGEWEWVGDPGHAPAPLPPAWPGQQGVGRRYESLEENCLVWAVSFGFNIGDRESSWQGASCCNNLRYICQA